MTRQKASEGQMSLSSRCASKICETLQKEKEKPWFWFWFCWRTKVLRKSSGSCMKDASSAWFVKKRKREKQVVFVLWTC